MLLFCNVLLLAETSSLLVECAFRSQAEGELLSLLTEVPDLAGLHTQLLVHRQEWSELQLDLLAKVDLL